METLIEGELKQTICDLNGKIEERAGCPHHFYIVLTSKKYNLTSREHVLAVPITSEIGLESLNYGINLTNEDIEGPFKLDKEPSFVLYDRICRLKLSKDLKLNHKKECIPKECTKVSKGMINRIKDWVSLFIKYEREHPIE